MAAQDSLRRDDLKEAVVDEEHLKALNEIWTVATSAWGTMRDIAKRCSRSQGDFKQRSASDKKFEAAYKITLELKNLVSGAVKALEKVVDLANAPEKKLEKMGIDEVIKQFKKSDRIVDAADASIAKYTIWHRKYEKELGIQISKAPEMKAFHACTERYLKIRSLLNKKLQNFQRMAHV